MNNSFVHLHAHTEYSMLDGAAKITDYLKKVKELNQPAAAITDHGNLYGALEFVRQAESLDIKPIIGYEAYVTPGSRFDRPDRDNNKRYHLTLLAENNVGYQNLVELVSKAYLEGFYYKPRVDYQLLSEHSEGIIALSGCLGGEVAQHLAPDGSKEEGNIKNEKSYEKALEKAKNYQEIFGKDNFFIEIHNHGISQQLEILDDLVSISEELEAPLVAANDSHYVSQDDSSAHDALLCVQTNATMEDENRFKFDGEEYYVKSSEEMRTLFPDDKYPNACDNTLKIANRVHYEFEFDKDYLPDFPVQDDSLSIDEYLRKKVLIGAEEKYEDVNLEIQDRIDYELEVINSMGLASYFLIVGDLIDFAKSKNIRTGAGRGSAAGSIVSYCLGITGIEPLKYGLIFERFLNKGRKSLPDIDMDFDERYRGDVIQYAIDKYGKDRVAHIVTFATIKAKQAIRDASRVLGLPFLSGDKVAKMMPPMILGNTATISECLNLDENNTSGYSKEFYSASEELRSEYKNNDEVKKIIDIALGLEGLRRQDGIHAAAIVISPDTITNFLPIQQKGENAEIVTQYEMHTVEQLGLLKMDFLGLRNLSIIDRTLKLINNENLDFDNLELDDEKTFKLFSEGKMTGVFQLESRVAQSVSRNLNPKRFEDIVALVALIRPGPLGAGMHNEFADRANLRKEIEYLHPDLKEVLEDTYGVILYQEQVMQIAQKIAGFDLQEADNLRVAMGKKIPQVMEEQRKKFTDGAVYKNYSEQFAIEVFDQIAYFAGYGFNKSHSVPYALLAYQTAYLKANFPAEYLAASLTAVKRDKDRTAIFLAEARDMGVSVSTPDINLSSSDFTVNDNEILFGLSAVRNVGDITAEKIVQERNENGTFKTVEDFLSRIDSRSLNKRGIEALIQGGGFDQFGLTRKGLFQSSIDLIEDAKKLKSDRENNQGSLFNFEDQNPDKTSISKTEWAKKELLEREREMLGFFVSEDPLDGYGAVLKSESSHSIIELLNTEEDELEDLNVVIAGLISNVQKRVSRRGNPWIQFDLQDVTGSTGVLLFNKLVDKYNTSIEGEIYLKVSGTYVGGTENIIRARDMQVIDPSKMVENLDTSPLRIVADTNKLDKNNMILLRELLEKHPGLSDVELEVTDSSGTRLMQLNEIRVKKTNQLKNEISTLLSN
ncbi:DNA polymerase III subunit alpha [Candidatus Actinomarina]|nr:DNA polymerase III subunit alpha [Candidatus Actinomarina sp.]